MFVFVSIGERFHVIWRKVPCDLLLGRLLCTYCVYLVCICMHLHILICIRVYWCACCYTRLKGPCFSVSLGNKLVYLPSPKPVLYVVPLSHILGRLPLVPAGDDGTIPWNMHCCKAACYPRGVCDRQGSPGSGSPLVYINSWPMICQWPVDYKKDAH